MNDFAKQLKEVLVRRKFTQGQLARAADLSTTHVSNIVNGRRLPTNGTLTGICRALELNERQCRELALALGRVRYPAARRTAAKK